ncbi:MAG: hypothetical protein QW579_06015 [Desulfurococcaceae archaeon]
MLLRVLGKRRFLRKCYDDMFLDFLVQLASFESSGLKIYHLFESIRRGDIELGECYSALSNQYTVLESSLGAPHLALRKIAESVPSPELSKFLRDYSTVLVTSGNTKYFVESMLKQEFARFRAKVNEHQRALDTLYEAYLVGVLVLMFLMVLPIWGLLPLLGLLVIYALGVTGYFFAYRICVKLHYTLPGYVVFSDILFSTLAVVLALSFEAMLLLPALLLVLHVTTRKHVAVNNILEQESFRVIYDTYSQVLMGRPVSTALLESLGSSSSARYRLLWFSLMLGVNPKKVLKIIKLPKLAYKILLFSLAMMLYSSAEGKHLVHAVDYLDEIASVRKQVREKIKQYVLYSFVVIVLVVAAYIMLLRIPLASPLDKHAFSAYSSIGFLMVMQPAVLIRDGGFTSSRSAIAVVFAAFATYLVMMNLTI